MEYIEIMIIAIAAGIPAIPMMKEHSGREFYRCTKHSTSALCAIMCSLFTFGLSDNAIVHHVMTFIAFVSGAIAFYTSANFHNNNTETSPVSFKAPDRETCRIDRISCQNVFQ